MIQIYLRICWYYIVNKTTRFKTEAKTKTEGHKTKTIGPIATYSLPTVNEIIFTAQYSITFAHCQLHIQVHVKVLNIKYYKSIHVKIVSQ